MHSTKIFSKKIVLENHKKMQNINENITIGTTLSNTRYSVSLHIEHGGGCMTPDSA